MPALMPDAGRCSERSADVFGGAREVGGATACEFAGSSQALERPRPTGLAARPRQPEEAERLRALGSASARRFGRSRADRGDDY